MGTMDWLKGQPIITFDIVLREIVPVCRRIRIHVFWHKVRQQKRRNGGTEVQVMEWRQGIRSGGLLSPKSYMDVPAEPRKSDFLYINFSPNYQPISIPFSIEKHLILPKLGAFYNNLLKIHPIFEFGLFRLCWRPAHRYTKFREKAPQ